MIKNRYTLILLGSVFIYVVSFSYTLTQMINVRNFGKTVSQRTLMGEKKSSTRRMRTEKSDTSAFSGSLTNIFSPGSGLNIKSRLAEKTDIIVSESDKFDSFALSGTIFSPDPTLRRAIIFLKKEREEKYLKEGDTFLSGYVVVKIERGSIIIRKNGALSRLEMSPIEKGERVAHTTRPVRSRTIKRFTPEKKGNLKVSRIDDSTFAVDESSVDYLTENINKLITHVRIIPYFESGEPAGFRLAAIRPGSEFSLLGFSPGDIIKKVNGIPLTSPEKIYTIFQNLKDEKKVEVDILRRGQKKTIVYEIR